MYRKSILLVIALFALLIFAACATTAPQSAPAEEAEAAPTEAPAEEAEEEAEEAATEEPVEEAAADEEASEDGDAASYIVDTEASAIEWYGSKPIGASETGTVQIAEGELSFAGDQLVEGSMVIDMTSIAPTSKTGDMLNMLTGHLMSDDFFGVETYPTAMLVLKSAEPTDVEGQYAVTADLTIKETTDEIEFLTDVVVGDSTLEATSEMVVDRSIYDVQYGSGAFFSDLGDELISDEMEFTVTLVANQ